VRCVVLTGVGKAFSVGSDIRDFSMEIGWLLENDYVEAGLNEAIENSPLPVIAALNGHALGGEQCWLWRVIFRVAAQSVRRWAFQR
jgi:enoyl-CoA hydratase/carnithine racemase